MPMIAMINMVLVTPADRALKRCSFLLVAPEHMDRPGISSTPARIDPMSEPSTSLAFSCVKAMAYRMISMIEPNVALITAPHTDTTLGADTRHGHADEVRQRDDTAERKHEDDAPDPR